MKATVDAAALRDAVAWAHRILPKRPVTSLQVLAGLLLTATDDGTLRVCGFDYETGVTATVPATVHEPGRMLVPGDVLAGLVAKMPDGPVDLLPDGTRIDIRGTGLRAWLPLLPAEDYPTLPALPGEVGRVPAEVLRDGVDRVAVAAGRDDTLPVLTGLRLEFGALLGITATDRYRIALIDLPYERPLDSDATASALVPAATLRALVRGATGTITLHAGDGEHPAGGSKALLGVSWEGRQVTSRVLDGTHPPVRKLFTPEKITDRVSVDRAALLDAVARVTPTGDRHAPLLLAADGEQLTVTMAGSRGQASTTLPATLDGQPREWHYNPVYLRDALRALHGDRVVIGLLDGEKPTQIIDPDDSAYQHMLAHIRVYG